MKFSTVLAAAAPMLAAASAIPRASSFCPEASRFGNFIMSPPTVKPGDAFSITANYTCAVESYDIVPSVVDYYIVVTENNNGHEPPILLAHRDWPAETDTFTGTLPYAYYVADAEYSILMQLTYPVSGTNGSPVHITGGVYGGSLIVPS